MSAQQFWDDIFSEGQKRTYSRIEMPNLDNHVYKRAIDHFGKVEGKTIIDLGCGSGSSSLFFAFKGAKVISIDTSEVAINNLVSFCQENEIKNIKPIRMAANEINNLGTVDLIFGSMILHHIEPFDKFARILRETIRSEGKAFFYENNAQSKILIWFRQNIVGKLWVPKYGDPDEFPLTTDEVDGLKKHFNVEIEIPELHLFRMISSYLLRGKLKKPFLFFDDYFFKYPSLRKHSYRQYILLD